MWSQYDENLGDNPFFKEIQGRHRDIIEKACKENWIICVPRIGTFDIEEDISMEIILDHILVPTAEQSYCSLSKKEISIRNKHIHIDSILLTNDVEILFEETFYVEKTAKYSVWCVDSPLFLKYQSQQRSHTTTVLENLHDCIDFLWVGSYEHSILDNIRQLSDGFMEQHKDFETESLQTQKDLIGNLYSQCLQVGFKCGVIKEKSMESPQFLENFKISVETYMQYWLGRKLVFSVNTLLYQTDSYINKVIRNSSDVQQKQLNIPSHFSDVLTAARCELNKINNYVTVLDKIFCLKRTFNIIFEGSKLGKSVCITSDDLLQLLVLLILKVNVSNWAANLLYIKEFRLSLLDNTDQNNFFITSLEAAIEFIKSNRFVEIKSASIKANVYSNSSHLTVETIFEQIETGQINFNSTTSRSSIEEKMCHPLCTCPKCEDLIRYYDDITGFNPHRCNDKGQNYLILASIIGNCGVIECLLQENFDVNFADNLGRTSLHYAASGGFQDILLLLINSGANVNALDNEKNMALHLASNNGHENCIKALIYSSPEVELNVGNFFGETPLHLAAKWGYFDIIKILLENGASIVVHNKRNKTAIDVAPNYYILKLFQDFGVERSVLISNGIKEITSNVVQVTSALVDCKEHGIRPKTLEQRKKIELLLKAIESNDLQLTCFYLGFSCNWATSTVKNTCHPLCDCDKCQGEQDDEDDSKQKPPQAININACDANGYTPLLVAAKFDRTDILRLLLDCGAPPNVRTYTALHTPLHVACYYQHIKIVRELLKCGNCQIDAQDAKGNTPLYYACAKNDVKIVELLLFNGAGCNKKNFAGQSPLQQSEESMQYRVFKLLKNSLMDNHHKDSDLFCDC